MSQQVYHLGSRDTFICYSRGLPSNDVTFQARVCANEGTGSAVDEEGDALKQADISTITRTIYTATGSDPATATSGPTSLTVSSVVVDTLTNDNLWTLDSIGRNFADTVTTFDAANAIYRVVYTFTLTGGAVMTLVYQHTTTGGGAT